jgi:hypothetical protein
MLRYAQYDMTPGAQRSSFGPDDWWRDETTRADVLHELGGIVEYATRADHGGRPWQRDPQRIGADPCVRPRRDHRRHRWRGEGDED